MSGIWMGDSRMRTADKKLIFLVALFVTSVTTANVLAGKIVVFGDYIILPAAVVTYAFTFLLTDIISELYGRQAAQRAVFFGFYAQLFAMAMIYTAMLFPALEQEMQDAYEMLLGQNFRFVAASMAAYFVSQSWDVWVFHKLKNKTNGKHKWLRNNASTMTSQFIDTAIFITIGFWGTVPNLWAMILSQYCVKLVLALLDTPFFYLFTKQKNRR